MKKVRFIAQAAIVAALYVVLTLLANALGLASYAIQVRFSEALTILPFFTPAAIPGLFIGCIISNLLCGSILWDIIFGSLATLLGALGTYYIGKKLRSHTLAFWLSPLPGGIFFFMLTVGAGEIISCGILGLLLLKTLQKYAKYIFPTE